MRLAILSDIHDNIWALEKALNQLDSDIDALLLLGDYCAPFSLKQVADAYAGPIHAVFGNNDGDTFLLMQIAAGAGNVTFYHPLGELSFEGCQIAITHYPEVAEGLAALDRFDAVFSGHTHIFMQKQVGNTLWVNPGEVMGRFGEVSFVYFETKTKEVERIIVEK